jgi:hypothetical protein
MGIESARRCASAPNVPECLGLRARDGSDWWAQGRNSNDECHPSDDTRGRRVGADASQLSAAGHVAALMRRSQQRTHALSHGGPRAPDPGSQVSMQIIRPFLHSGQSHNDAPVSRW